MVAAGGAERVSACSGKIGNREMECGQYVKGGMLLPSNAWQRRTDLRFVWWVGEKLEVMETPPTPTPTPTPMIMEYHVY
jgi:hypothetical protein